MYKRQTIDRVEQVHTEQMNYVEIYTQQISRWRKEKPSAAQARELDRMDTQNQQLRALTADVLALASELREGTIERVSVSYTHLDVYKRQIRYRC